MSFFSGTGLAASASPFSGPAQGRDLLFGQLAKLAWLNIQRDPTVARALDLLHVMADLFEHAADLAVLALVSVTSYQGLSDSRTSRTCAGAVRTERMDSAPGLLAMRIP